VSKFPPERLDDERFEIYRVTIQADVASGMGTEPIMEKLHEMFESNEAPENWDVFDVSIEKREEPPGEDSRDS
jgi:hypothetical protein